MKGFSEYIAEEYIHEMSRSDKSQFQSHIKNLLMNHFQIKFVGGRDVNHWRKEMMAWERKLAVLVKRESNLKSEPVNLQNIYARLIRQRPFLGELREKFPNVAFPAFCPFTLEDVVGQQVWGELQK